MLIWAACRHHVGTHSYAVTYAKDIAHIIETNRKCFEEYRPERLNFLARDIRANISDILGYRANMHIENAYNDRIREDAFTLLIGYLVEHPDCDPLKTDFTIDCVKCKVIAEPYVPKPQRIDTNGEVIYTPPIFDPYREFYDLSFWMKLAASIDRRRLCVTEYNGNVSEHDVIYCPELEYDWDEQQHCNVNPHFAYRYICTDNWNTSIAKEYIKEIKDIER